MITTVFWYGNVLEEMQHWFTPLNSIVWWFCKVKQMKRITTSLYKWITEPLYLSFRVDIKIYFLLILFFRFSFSFVVMLNNKILHFHNFWLQPKGVCLGCACCFFHHGRALLHSIHQYMVNAKRILHQYSIGKWVLILILSIFTTTFNIYYAKSRKLLGYCRNWETLYLECHYLQ